MIKSKTLGVPILAATEKSENIEYGHSLWSDALKRLKRNRMAMTCFYIIAGYFLLAIFCQLGVFFPSVHIVNYDIANLSPSLAHWFGTDLFGRDVLARAAHGTVTSLTVGLVGGGLSVIIGTYFGAISGYFGGKVDDIVVWFYTTIDTIPYILLIASFSFVMGASLQTMCLVFGLTSWVSLCRLVRGEFMKHKTKEYVQGASAVGASHGRKIFLHILPNIYHLILINFSLTFVSIVKGEVILSFLGLGVEPGIPSWGMMINDAKQELAAGIWWNLAAATLFMFCFVLAFNLFNDSLREALDPKLKNRG